MPKQNAFDYSYPSKLRQIGLDLLQPFKGAKKHHTLKCLVCKHIWKATPISKIQTNKQHHVNGCPTCNKNRKDSKYKKHREQRLIKLAERGIEILTDGYDGRLRLDYNKTLKEEKIRVRNTKCGHIFLVTPLNLLQSSVDCPTCNTHRKREQFRLWTYEKQRKYFETATEWQKYKSHVFALTRLSYKKHRHVINPQNLPTGRAGTPGAYHLDHIVPVRYCFENSIPEDVCADYTNLQMIQWRENVSLRNHLKQLIPPIFNQYIQ